MQFTVKTEKGLMGLTQIWEECNEHGMPVEEPPFQIRADEAGVRFQGTSRRLATDVDLEYFAKIITEAWVKYQGLRPKMTNQAGH